MNLRLRCNRPPEEEIRRVVFAELEHARTRSAAALHQAAALHEVRKSLKRLRSNLDLARPCFGPAVATEARRLRDVARTLALHREMDALAAVLRAEARHAGINRIADLQSALQLHQVASRVPANRSRDLAVARRTLTEVAKRLERRPCVEMSAKAVWRRYRRSYRRARRACREATATLAADALHEWRKNAKHLLNQTRLLQSWGAPELKRYRRELSRLDDLLGRARDCELLVGILRGVPAMEEPRRNGRGLRARLQAVATAETARAVRIGRRLFRRKPRDFVARVMK